MIMFIFEVAVFIIITWTVGAILFLIQLFIRIILYFLGIPALSIGERLRLSFVTLDKLNISERESIGILTLDNGKMIK